MRVDLPYLELFRVKGRLYAYYRRDGLRVRLQVDAATKAELIAAWSAQHEKHEAANKSAGLARDERAIRPRSISDLISRYRASPEWSEKKPETRRDYEKALRPLETNFGKLPVVGLQRHHVTAIRDHYAHRDGPDGSKLPNARQANRVITVLSILLTLATELGWRPDNPALRPKRLRKKTEGYVAWTTEQFRLFWERSDSEWQFAAALALLTVQRGQDLVAMTWSDHDPKGNRIHVTQQKGNGQVKLWVPVHPFLRPMLAHRRKEDATRDPAPLSILSRPDGTAWQINAFQKAAGKAIRAAGLKGVVWHGLRASGLSWAAEGGASDLARMNLAGHSQTQTAKHYARGAGQQALAAQAVAAIPVPVGNRTRASVGNKVPNPTAKLVSKKRKQNGEI